MKNDRILWDGSQLKLAAAVSMWIDHVGYRLVGGDILPLLTDGGTFLGLGFDGWQALYFLFRCIGRIAFPIFAFLCAEGFAHTSSRKRYLIRLGVFALLSEIPFDLMCTGRLVSFESQNVLFTFFLGAAMLWGQEFARMRYPGRRGERTAYFIVIAAALAAIFLHTDYSVYGIFLIFLFAQQREDRRRALLFGFCWMLLSISNVLYIPGLAVSFLLLLHYSGRRGRVRFRYGYYLFYPAHMLLLVLIGGSICSLLSGVQMAADLRAVFLF